MAEKPAKPRIFVVEDETLICMLLEDFLADLGYEVAGPATSLEKGLAMAQDVEADLGLLDVNLNGKHTFPIADILIARAIPVVYATGYGLNGLPERYINTPVLQKPFERQALSQVLATALQANREQV
jgi:CheY-like chemotaxis protein